MKVSVTKEERNLPYFKYYEREMAAVPDDLKEAMQEGPADPANVLPFDRRNDFLRGADQEFCQTGYAIMEDGSASVCTSIYMPGVKPEMLDWWFPWHSVGSDLRYKIWDPEDHYFATAHPASIVVDPSVPVHQKTWGVDHYIVEDVGFGPQFMKISFIRPADIGCDESIIGTPYCSGMVVGIGRKTNTTMIHKWYTYKDGVMFLSRFWVGQGILPDGSFGLGLPPGKQIPAIFAQKLLEHDIKEYVNLASFLPEIYEEEKENF